MKIAITGSTGQLGQLIISRLKDKIPSGNIIALARSPEKAKDFGVEVREADYDKPETLKPAFDGVDTLLMISASEVGKRARQHANVIEAAKDADIKWIVYTSLLHADSTSINLGEEHVITEKALKETGIPFTILRNGWYTENYAASVPMALESGAVIGSAEDGKISAATRADYADAAVAVLTGDGHEGKTYELAGDDAFTLEDLADEISRQSGKSITYKNMPEKKYAAALADAGLPEAYAKQIASWDVSTAKGDLFNDSRQLSKLIGRPTTPLSDTVAVILEEGS